MPQTMRATRKNVRSHQPGREAAGHRGRRTLDSRTNPSGNHARKDNGKASWRAEDRPAELAAIAAPSHGDPRAVLLALRARLRGDMTQMADATLNGHHRETGSIPLDTADLASDNFEQDVTLSLLGSATGALAQIENALERVNEGTYGQCEQCGDKIPAARLDALPHTTMCVQCASRQEKRGRW